MSTESDVEKRLAEAKGMKFRNKLLTDYTVEEWNNITHPTKTSYQTMDADEWNKIKKAFELLQGNGLVRDKIKIIVTWDRNMAEEDDTGKIPYNKKKRGVYKKN